MSAVKEELFNSHPNSLYEDHNFANNKANQLCEESFRTLHLIKFNKISESEKRYAKTHRTFESLNANKKINTVNNSVKKINKVNPFD